MDESEISQHATGSANFLVWKNEGTEKQSSKLLFGSSVNLWFGKGSLPLIKGVFIFQSSTIGGLSRTSLDEI